MPVFSTYNRLQTVLPHGENVYISNLGLVSNSQGRNQALCCGSLEIQLSKQQLTQRTVCTFGRGLISMCTCRAHTLPATLFSSTGILHVAGHQWGRAEETHHSGSEGPELEFLPPTSLNYSCPQAIASSLSLRLPRANRQGPTTILWVLQGEGV